MKNILEFYYNLSLEEKILNRNGNYYFVVNNNSFVFRPFYGNNNSIDDIYKLNNYLSNFSYIDKIILNKFNSPITKVKDNLYVLILLKGNNNINLSLTREQDLIFIEQLGRFFGKFDWLLLNANWSKWKKITSY